MMWLDRQAALFGHSKNRRTFRKLICHHALLGTEQTALVLRPY
jgi:hypothetical protein